MRASELNISSEMSLESFYCILEENALQLAKEQELAEAWLKFRDQSLIESDTSKAQWEVEVFLFSFQGSNLFSLSNSNGKKVGTIKQYPDLNELQIEAFEYIKNRALTTKSNILKARYNHLLWKGIIGKNKQYANAAIQYYIKAIREYYELILKEGVRENTFELGRLYENLIALVNEIKYLVDEFKELTCFLLFEDNQLPFYAKHGFIDDMLKYPKIFKSADFENVLSLFVSKLSSKSEKSDDFSLINYHLPTAIKVAQKTKTDVSRWYNEIGNANVRMASKEKDNDERSWIKLDLYNKAIEAYRKAGNLESKKQTEQLYFLLKPYVRLTEYKIDFSNATIKQLKILNKKLKEDVKKLLKNDANTVYSTIANGDFFPKRSTALKYSQERKIDFFDGVHTVHFDNNKNISNNNDDDNENFELLKAYGDLVNQTLLLYLHYTFYYGIKSGHLTARNFLEFLVQKSWIGRTTVSTDLGGHLVKTNWARLLMPSINEYYNQMLSWGASKYYVPSFILCVDSLAIKIEGLFRSFSERLNVSTSIGKKKGMQETLLNNILENEVILKYFNEDDRLFFEYVFSEKGGLNLRNNTAHSFYNEYDYNSDKMLILIAVVLRLAKYDIKVKEK